eukprot:Hpha_TRINITY_DN27171_c0_g1::TRINITY_DN27171_c0_g1_i1::g.29263::m.29263
MRQICILSFAVTALAGSPLLNDPAFEPLPTGSVTPQGWLLDQLKIQAEGLTGHLSMFWNDVMSSVWIGGKGDAGLHERTPYWLNGVVPLAFLLKNAGVEELAGVAGIWKMPWGSNASLCTNGTDLPGATFREAHAHSAGECYQACLRDRQCKAFVFIKDKHSCALKEAGVGEVVQVEGRCFGRVGVHTPPPINVMAQAESYVDYIISHQGSDGWLGPASTGGDQYWGPSNVLLALTQYSDAIRPTNATRAAQASKAVLLHLLQVQKRLPSARMTEWSMRRYMDQILAVQWLLDREVPSADQAKSLIALIDELHSQGSDWETWFEYFNNSDAGNHNVNNAQALKSAAVLYRRNKTFTSHGFDARTLSVRRTANMDKYYGLPHGGFNGDELLPSPATRHPSRGFETCGVVEAMFSYNTMFSVHGDVLFADKAERLAYNALPATWASPTGGDMWAHQYLQAVNEITAENQNDHIWGHDGPLSETYGLEPNYGCCTANFNQGWPKFASMLFFRTKGGIAVGAYAPAVGVDPATGTRVNVTTDYPFNDKISVTVDAKQPTKLFLRIPAWAVLATVNGDPAANGTMYEVSAPAGTSTFIIDLAAEVRVEEWDMGALSVHHGALLYSLPILPNYTVYAHHFGTDTQSNDYYLSPTSPWRYALDLNRSDLNSGLKFALVGRPGAAPFNHSGWATSIKARVRSFPDWGLNQGSAAAPASPACSGLGPYVEGMDLYGGDIAPCGSTGCKGKSLDECEALCVATKGCVAYVYNPGTDCEELTENVCWTKGPDHQAPAPKRCRNYKVVSAKDCGEPEWVTLVPHGGTELRIGEFPTV